MCDECRNWKPQREKELKTSNFINMSPAETMPSLKPEYVCTKCHGIIRQKRCCIKIKTAWELMCIFVFLILIVCGIICFKLIFHGIEYAFYVFLMLMVSYIVQFIVIQLGHIFIEKMIDKYYAKTYEWVDAPSTRNDDI